MAMRLFDTLYHATALEYDARLVTADDRYHRKAHTLPGIIHLRDFRPDGSKLAADPKTAQ
jgi:hypothetical protein